MKKTMALLAILLLLGAAFTACNNSGASSGAPASSGPASASSAVSVGSSLPASASEGAGASSAAAPAGDLDAILAAVSEAAGLGGTIAVSEIDLSASGVNMDNVVAFAGAESQLSVENGGIVLVIQAAEGKAADVAANLESFRDARAADDRYAEFAGARDNTAKARIVTEGDIVVYAVDATGTAEGLAAVDAAISAALA